MNNERAHSIVNCWCGHGGLSHQGEAVGPVTCRMCRPAQMDDHEGPTLALNRRRFERFVIPHPIRTSVGSSPAYVVDASLAGIGVLQHSAAAPPVGTTCKLMFHSDFGSITLECEIMRTAADSNDGTFQTGLRIVAANGESESRLRMLVMALAVPSTKSSGH